MCCSETGNAGLAILIICVILSFLYGVGIWLYASLSFFCHDLEKPTWHRIALTVVLAAIGMLVCIGGIIAAFFNLDLNAGYAGFTICFVGELGLFCVALYAWHFNQRNSISNAVALFSAPIFMGICVIGVIFLLVEQNHLGLTAMMGIIIAVIIIDFCNGLGLWCCAVYFIIRREIYGYVYFIGPIVAGILIFMGIVPVLFFDLSNVAAIVGFFFVLIVQTVIVIYFAYPYILAADETIFRFSMRLLMLFFSTLFAGVTLIGIFAAAIRLILGAPV